MTLEKISSNHLDNAWNLINTSSSSEIIKDVRNEIHAFAMEEFETKMNDPSAPGKLNRILYKIFEEEKKEKTKSATEQNQELINEYDKCLEEIVSILSPSELPKNANPQVISKVFNNIMDLLNYDAHEEVVGQERPMGIIPRQVAKNLVTENKDVVAQLSAQLYPIALLTLNMKPEVKIPQNQDEKALVKEANQFVREFKAQFGFANKNIWKARDFFNAMKSVWDVRRQGDKL